MYNIIILCIFLFVRFWQTTIPNCHSKLPYQTSCQVLQKWAGEPIWQESDKRLTARQGGCTSTQQQYPMQCREANPNQSELYRLSCSTFHHHSLHSSTSHSRDTLQAFERNALTQKFVYFDSHSGLSSYHAPRTPTVPHFYHCIHCIIHNISIMRNRQEECDFWKQYSLSPCDIPGVVGWSMGLGELTGHTRRSHCTLEDDFTNLGVRMVELWTTQHPFDMVHPQLGR